MSEIGRITTVALREIYDVNAATVSDSELHGAYDEVKRIIASVEVQLTNKNQTRNGRRMTEHEYQLWRSGAVAILQKARLKASEFKSELRQRNLVNGEDEFREKRLRQQTAMMVGACYTVTELAHMDADDLAQACVEARVQAGRILDAVDEVANGE